MNKLKIMTWADLCYIVTLLYGIFVLCGFFIQFSAEVNFFGKDYETTLNWFTYIQVINKNLKAWKLYLMLTCLGVVAFLIDRFILIPFLTRYTKQGKILRKEIDKKWKEIKD